MNIALVTNTQAGSGRAITLAKDLAQHIHNKHHTSTLYTEAHWDDRVYKHDQVWIVGGDGTLNYFINRYPDIQTPLCLFNGGTGNDFYALLYGNITVADQVDMACKGATRRVDAGRCNDRYFINGVGIGFEGAVAKSLMGVNKMPGKTSFLLAILKQILFYNEQEYDIQSTPMQNTKPWLMISVANGKRYAGGFYVAPLAEPDDGKFDVNLVKPLTAFQRLKFLPVIEKGKHVNHPYIEYYQTNSIKITSTKLIQAHLDGEYLEGRELKIELLPKYFQFIC